MTSIPVKTASTLEKKDVQKLQRAIIDGLEDVKAQDIQVFDTEHITSLFERVIVASGSSNRQTKALAASVRDAVRDAGFAKPRIEGEENGEWIIVDCGAAVAHIMQPTIRQYYHLEELWGDKPIKLKLGAPAPLVKASKPAPKAEPAGAPRAKPGVKSGAKAGSKSVAGSRSRSVAKPAVKKVPVRDYEPGYIGKLGKTSDWTARRNEAAPAEEPAARPVKTTRAPAKKAAASSASKPATKAVAKPAPRAVKKPLVEIPVAKKVAARKVAVKSAAKPAARKTAPKSR
jgi:ribosome-associated protein